ncbi:MAG: family N-acetyltransferase [Ferruginibacter sp.]|nr:family N-acetyltransferase [Ferruginibacter sp.]
MVCAECKNQLPLMEIRSAGITDIPSIRVLAYDTWPAAYGAILSQAQLTYMLELIYSEHALQEQMSSLAHRFIIITDAGRDVGFASYSQKANAAKGIFRLHKLYVLPDQQGKGTGKKLLDYLIADISRENAEALELNVNRNNKAFDFYKKMGFDISREEDIDIGAGYFMNDYVMTKLLK